MIIPETETLMWCLRARQEMFHTGWFVESVLSAALVVFALRTRQSFRRSRPSRGMQLVTAGVALVALILPYTPLARMLGFVPVPPLFLLVVAVIVVLYFAVAELTKRWFFKRFEG